MGRSDLLHKQGINLESFIVAHRRTPSGIMATHLYEHYKAASDNAR